MICVFINNKCVRMCVCVCVCSCNDVKRIFYVSNNCFRSTNFNNLPITFGILYMYIQIKYMYI